MRVRVLTIPGQHEFITLPAEARPRIVDCLRRAGIDVVRSREDLPPALKNAGTVYACKEGRGQATILVMDEAEVPQGRSMVVLLIFSGRGRLADTLLGTNDHALRKKIGGVLQDLKSQLAAQTNRVVS